jgi:hypothetical protein
VIFEVSITGNIYRGFFTFVKHGLNISVDYGASIFYPEVKGSRFLRRFEDYT